MNDHSEDYQRHYEGKRVVVLGSSGFIGRWVAAKLCKAGAQLILPVRDRSAADRVFDTFGVQGEIVGMDIVDDDSLLYLYKEFRPTITFNLAGYGIDPLERDEGNATRVNTRLVESVCRVTAQYRDGRWPGQDVVHAGSAMEYGRVTGDLAEETQALPTTLYGRTKLAGTIALSACCRQYGLKGLTARMFAVYGPGEAPHRLLPTLIRSAGSIEVIGLTAGLHRRDFVYVEESAEALVRLGVARSRPGEIVNIATGRLNSIRSFAETAGELLHLDPTRLGFGLLPTRPEEMDHQPVTNRRLFRLTTWTPTMDIAEGIKRTLAFADPHGRAVCA